MMLLGRSWLLLLLVSPLGMLGGRSGITLLLLIPPCAHLRLMLGGRGMVGGLRGLRVRILPLLLVRGCRSVLPLRLMVLLHL